MTAECVARVFLHIVVHLDQRSLVQDDVGDVVQFELSIKLSNNRLSSLVDLSP